MALNRYLCLKNRANPDPEKCFRSGDEIVISDKEAKELLDDNAIVEAEPKKRGRKRNTPPVSRGPRRVTEDEAAEAQTDRVVEDDLS